MEGIGVTAWTSPAGEGVLISSRASLHAVCALPRLQYAPRPSGAQPLHKAQRGKVCAEGVAVEHHCAERVSEPCLCLAEPPADRSAPPSSLCAPRARRLRRRT